MKYLICLIVIFLTIFVSESITTYQHEQTLVNLELNKHNYYRAFHGAPRLILNSAITRMAQNYANKLASTRTFQHSGVRGYGENLYMTTGQYRGGQATISWYNEFTLYNYQNPGFSMQTGHFTQVIWKKSKYVGFGFRNGYVVANYQPPGNYQGQFPSNVLPRR